MEEEVFNRFDKNGDGKISSTELANVLRALGSNPTQEEVKKIMAELDINGDGFIDLKEFAELYKASNGGGGEEEEVGNKELREAFDMYDKNKNGLISASELHMVFKSLGEKCTVRDCRKMIRSVDVDGDGNVNFEEFKKMMGGGGGGGGIGKSFSSSRY